LILDFSAAAEVGRNNVNTSIESSQVNILLGHLDTIIISYFLWRAMLQSLSY